MKFGFVLANRFQRRSLKMVNGQKTMTTDARARVYYILAHQIEYQHFYLFQQSLSC